MTSDTISNILQDLSDMRGESTTNTDANRIRAVSRAERDIANRKLFGVHRLKQQTTTGDGTNTYTIGSATYPMREKGLFELYVGGLLDSQKYDVIDYINYLSRYNSNNADRVAYEYWDDANSVWKVYINPAPESGVTIYYSYFYTPPRKTSTSDVVVCPNMDALRRLSLSYIYENEDEPELADKYLSQAEQIIREIMGLDDVPEVNNIKTVGAIEGKGIGTY